MSILKSSIVFSVVFSLTIPVTAKEAQSPDMCKMLAGKNNYVQKQAFSRDIPPFGRGCFAVLLEETPEGTLLKPNFFKEGKQLSSFNPSVLNSNLEPNNAFECTVDAVSFPDINADNLQDILVISTCLEKANPSKTFKNNRIYFNRGENGKFFESYSSVDAQASKYNTINDIKKNLK